MKDLVSFFSEFNPSIVRCIHKDKNTHQDKIIYRGTLERKHFLSGASYGTALLVANVAKSAFWLVINILTVGCIESYRQRLIDHITQIPLCACAIPVGLLGVAFPFIVNKEFAESQGEWLINNK